jgi:phospholipase A-2-activating protein
VHLPLISFIVMNELPSGFKAKILQKINEFNTIANNILDNRDIDSITQLIDILEDTSHYHATTIQNTHIVSIFKMIQQFNAMHTFPAYDILRIVCTHPSGAKVLATFTQLPQLLQHSTSTLNSTSDVSIPTLLCILRFLGNSLRYENLRQSFMKHTALIVSVFDGTRLYLNHENKSIKLATSNLLLNLSLSMNKTNILDTSQIITLSLSLISTLHYCIQSINDTEYLFRFLVAIGTILYINQSKEFPQNISTKNMSVEMAQYCVTIGIVDKIASIIAAIGIPNNVVECAKEILILLNATLTDMA